MSEHPQGLRIRPEREDGAIQVVFVSPAQRELIESVLAVRGLALFPIPIGPDEDEDADLPTFGIAHTTLEQSVAGRVPPAGDRP